MSHTLIHNSEKPERRVDVAEFADWVQIYGIDPVDAFKDLLGRDIYLGFECPFRQLQQFLPDVWKTDSQHEPMPRGPITVLQTPQPKLPAVGGTDTT